MLWRFTIISVSYTHLIIGAVGDIGGVGGALFIGAHAADGEAHGEAHPAVEIAHPFAVTAGEVFIDGDEMCIRDSHRSAQGLIW